MATRRLAPWIVAAVLCAAGSLGAHAVGYWLEPSGPAASRRATRGSTSCRRWSWRGIVALFASLAVETREILRQPRRPARCPAWLFLVLPAGAFLVQEHVERAAATAQLPVDTLAQPAVLAGLVLQLPFGIAALLAARLLTRAPPSPSPAGIGRAHAAACRSRADQRHDRTDPRPRRVELLQPAGRGPPAFAVP